MVAEMLEESSLTMNIGCITPALFVLDDSDYILLRPGGRQMRESEDHVERTGSKILKILVLYAEFFE